MAASTSVSPLSFFNEYSSRFIALMADRFPRVRREEIEDLFQDSFIILVKDYSSGKVMPESKWWSYLFSVGFRQMTKRMRGVKNMTLLSIDEEREDNAATLLKEMERCRQESFDGETGAEEREERYAIIENVLASFPEKAAGIITDKYLLGLTDSEIALKRNYANASTVKAKRFQVMRKAQQLCEAGAA